MSSSGSVEPISVIGIERLIEEELEEIRRICETRANGKAIHPLKNGTSAHQARLYEIR
jgi:low affinity Fe/Cu permease